MVSRPSLSEMSSPDVGPVWASADTGWQSTAAASAVQIARFVQGKTPMVTLSLAPSGEVGPGRGINHSIPSRGKTAEARDRLAPVYDWLTEGFDTADLREAKALLDKLS